MARQKKESDKAPAGKPKKAVSKAVKKDVEKAPNASSDEGSSPVSKPIYQFKITLLDIKPAIWRRIQIPDCTLEEMHDFIQAAFGWENYHLHQFIIDKQYYGPEMPDGGPISPEVRYETEVELSQLIPETKRKNRWIYEYDFGDGWKHEILFEGLVPADPKVQYPLCVEGERAGPPEDCGGPWGYGDFVQAITDRKHPRHKELLEWNGPFDPEKFSAARATREMRKYASS